MDRSMEHLPVERTMWFREDPDLHRSLDFIREEFRAGFELVRKIDRPGASIFGSARTSPDDVWYRRTMGVGAAFAREGFAVITGGGPGLMEAGNRGAKEAGGLSVGLGIELPHEQGLNDWLDLSYEFKHFYARKVCFVRASEGFVAAPGGWGTNDELFESLTLIQTHKIEHFPVVLFGSEHWRPFTEWCSRMVEEGLISETDLRLFDITDDPDECAAIVASCYRKTCHHLAGA